jgi:hypothetical protein
MAKWPFSLIWPGGLVNNQVPTHSDLNKLDEQQAQAADGAVWTDVAAFKNWGPPQAAPGLAAFYNSVSDVWVTVDVNGSNPRARVLLGSSGALTIINTASISALRPRKRAADFNPTAGVGLVGGLPGASSNKKYVRFPTCFTSTMATTVSSQTNTTAVACLKWVAQLGLWVAGHEGTGVVETSADALTFTSRTVPNNNPRISMAVGPVNGSSGGIVITSSTTTNKLIHSVDGINWIERTLPSSQAWTNVVYVPQLEKYVAIGEGGGAGMVAVAVSTDGITWTNQAFTLPPNSGTFSLGLDTMAVAFGRTVYLFVSSSFVSGNMMLYSQDAGASWKFAAGFFPASADAMLAANGRQLVYGDDVSTYLTIGSGF